MRAAPDKDGAMSETETTGKLLRVLRQMTSAVSNARYFGFGHPVVREYIRAAYHDLAELVRLTPTITLFFVGNQLVVDDRPLSSLGAFVDKFLVLLKDKGIERLTFQQGVTEAELTGFLAQLADKGGSPARSTPGIRLGKVTLLTPAGSAPPDDAVLPAEPRELPERLASLGDTELDRIRELYFLAERRRRFDVRDIDSVVAKFVNVLLSNFSPVSLLAAVKDSHEYTFTHAVNVGILTIVQAKSYGFSGRVLHEIGIASMLHDVGKIFIPDGILDKPGKLTHEEWAVIETHTIKGGRYLITQAGIPTVAVLAALEHHRRFDGSGYPVVAPDWKPNLISQMIAISDAFDAMRSRRAYGELKPQAEILEIIRKDRGLAFHPGLADNFISLIADEK
jgi:HD-GYP domain-containing protein (c-di-GMP phosphodiesterase class II)